jgi:predicted RNA-binding Zn ribbon-like protein
LRIAAAAREAEAMEALRQMREVREVLYLLFRSIAEGGEPPAAAITRLGAWWHDERSRRELIRENGAFALRLRVREGELDPMRWPVIASAVDFLLSDRTARLRRCAECDWLFVDGSRKGTRIWCKKECGDRERARRHYARVRRRAGESSESSESSE